MSSLFGGGSACVSPNCYICLLWWLVSSTSLRVANSPQLSKKIFKFFLAITQRVMSDFSRKSAQNRPFCKSVLYIYMGGT